MKLVNVNPERRSRDVVSCLNEISNIHWHLLNLGAVELLDLAHHADILSCDEVDGHAFAAESSTATDAVDVVLAVGREVVVDDQRDLLDIDTTSEKIRGDENARGARTELLHDDITLSLVHVAVHGGDSEVASRELVGEPVNLSTGIAEDDGLRDRDGFVEIGERVELPVFLFDSNIELFDALEG